MLRESLRMSIANILGNKMRSFLTILGIIIGVMAIITLITVMQSAQNEMTTQFESLGTGMVTVSVSGTPLKVGLSEKDLATIEKLDNVSGTSPSFSTTLSVVYGGTLQEDVTIEGKGFAHFRREADTMKRGRPLLPIDQEQKSRVCIIDSNLAEALFSGQDPLDQQLVVNGVRLRIVGLLSDEGDTSVLAQMGGGGDDGKVILPYTTYMRLLGLKDITSLDVYLKDSNITQDTVEELEAALDRAFNYKEDSYRVINMESLLDVMNTLMGLMTSLLTGIASIALLVGGIGIMNMMLVSVTERTSEIGLRKALGARPRSIQVQFLFESILLSLLGGAIGMILGVAISMLLAGLMDITFVLSPSAIGLGVGFSLAVGIIFGWAPARKASNLNPIDALRSN
ncbi:MAG: FtsX-like permease family protein [Clostridiales bacterium]|nr:FtsX-like permease family protein [Clostridiales bacterium]